jgi:hypothetical protein
MSWDAEKKQGDPEHQVRPHCSRTARPSHIHLPTCAHLSRAYRLQPIGSRQSVRVTMEAAAWCADIEAQNKARSFSHAAVRVGSIPPQRRHVRHWAAGDGVVAGR